MTGTTNSRWVREQAGLLPMKPRSVFISFPWDDIQDGAPTYVNTIRSALNSRSVQATVLDKSIPYIGGAEVEAIRSCAVAIICLGNRRLSPSNRQYDEVARLVDAVDGCFWRAGSDEALAARAAPALLCLNVYGDDELASDKRWISNPAEVLTRRFDMPNRSIVEALTNKHPRVHLKPLKKDGKDEDFLRVIREFVDDALSFSEDGGDAAAVEGGARARPAPSENFPVEAYLNAVEPVWRAGRAYRVSNDSDHLSLRPEHVIELCAREIGADDSDGPSRPALDALRDREGSVWLEGDPGSGKSTLLARAAVQEAELYREWTSVGMEGDRAPRLPLLFNLGRLMAAHRRIAPLPAVSIDGGGPDLGRIAAAMAEGICDHVACTPAAVASLLTDRNITVYLDGLDELSSDDQSLFEPMLAALATRTRVVLSARTERRRVLPRAAVLKVCTLNPDDILKFFGGLDKKERDRREGVHDLLMHTKDETQLRTPFFVSLLLKLDLREWKDLARRPERIYSDALKIVFKESLAGGRAPPSSFLDPDVARRVLARAALAYVERSTLTVAELLQSVQEELKLGVPEWRSERRAWRDFLINDTQLLLLHGDRSGGDSEQDAVSFIHRNFAEYLAALHVARTWVSAPEERCELLSRLLGGRVIGRAPTPSIALVALALGDVDDGDGSHEAACTTLFEAVHERLMEVSCTDPARSGSALEVACDMLRGVETTIYVSGLPWESLARLVGDVYERFGPIWSVKQRDKLLTGIARLPVGDLWARILGLSPLRGTEVVRDLVSIKREGTAPLSVARCPVLIRDYQIFANDPRRYDSKYWPLRSKAEAADARIHLMDPLKKSARYLVADTGVDDRKLVLGDIGERNKSGKEDWRQQVLHPCWPVSRVTWIEAVAFALWASEKDGRAYRLPTEAEVVSLMALAGQPEPSADSKTTVGAAPADKLGLYDLDRNVAIWTIPEPREGSRWWESLGPKHCIGGYFANPAARRTLAMSTGRVTGAGIRLVVA